MIGRRIQERYEITGELGRGGMGVVYEGFDRLLDREVAVKCVPPALLTPAAEERFAREARIVAQLEHQGIVPIHDLVRDGGALFLIMPLVRGRTLRSHLSERRLEVYETFDVVAQLAEALDYSHSRGVVHRDVKPENVMIPAGGAAAPLSARLMDFGVAQVIAVAPRLTGSGGIMGTPAYASPEQLSSEEVDGRADIYALGVILFECLTGDVPFRGELPALLHQILNVPAPSVRERGADVPAAIDELVAQCLAKQRERRPPRASLVAEGLARAGALAPSRRAHVGGGSATLPAAPDRTPALTDAEQGVLAAAAALGASFTVRDLALLLGPAPDLEDIVDRLVASGKLREEHGGAHERLAFTSDLLRREVYASLPRRRRRELHRAFAEGLEAAHAERTERVAERLSFHFARAGLAERAARHAAKAMRRAAADRRPSDAAAYARLVLDALDGVPLDEELAVLDREARAAAQGAPPAVEKIAESPEAPASRAVAPGEPTGASPSGAELNEQLGDTLWMAGRYEAALSCYRRAAEERRAGDPAVPGEVVAREKLRLSRVMRAMGKFEEAVRLADEGIAALGEGAPALSAELSIWAGLACCSAGRIDRAEASLSQARERAAGAGPSAPGLLLLDALLARLEGNCLLERGAPERAIEAFLRGLGAAERAGDEWERSIALFNLADAHLHAGDAGRADYYLDTAEEAKSSLGDRWGLAYVHQVRSRMQYERGHWRAAIASAGKSLRIAAEIGDLKTIAAARCLLGKLRLATGDVAGAENDFEVALQESEEAASVEAATASIGLAALAIFRSQHDRAEGLLEGAARHLDGAGAGRAELSLWMTRGQLAEARGRLTAADDAYRAALGCAERLGNPFLRTAAETALARASVARGQNGPTLETLRRLRDQAADRGDLLHRGLAALGLAERACLDGLSGEAVGLCEAAAHDFEALPARRLMGDAYRLLARAFLLAGEVRRAHTHARAALGVYESLGNAAVRELGQVQLVLGGIEREKGDAARSAQHVERALALLARAGETADLSEAHAALAAAIAPVDQEGALRELERAYELASALEHPLAEVRAASAAAELHLGSGQLGAAERDLERQRRALSRAELPRGQAAHDLQLARLRALRGDVPGALAAAEQALETWQRTGDDRAEAAVALRRELTARLAPRDGTGAA